MWEFQMRKKVKKKKTLKKHTHTYTHMCVRQKPTNPNLISGDFIFRNEDKDYFK